MGDDPGPTPDGRFDERDTMFARMARREGTPAYDEYYARRPELRRSDDRMVRRAPWTHRMAVWLDDLVYGRRWNPAASGRVKGV